VTKGQVLHVSLPLPPTYRRYDISAASYAVYALMRHAVPGRPPVRVGLMFLGRQPPKGYEKSPAGLFLLPSDPKPAFAVKRQHVRHALVLNVRLRRADPGVVGPAEELTITEDLSLGGARVRTALPLAAASSWTWRKSGTGC
jgi:hypothetical protein